MAQGRKTIASRARIAIEGSNGNIAEIARRLGVSRTTVYNLIHKHHELAEQLYDERHRADLPRLGPRPPHKPDARPTIYLVQQGSGPIKIGYTTNLHGRFAALDSSSPYPLTLLLAFPGGPRKERELHHRWREYRIRGEWYQPAPALLDWIRECRHD